MTEKRPTMIVPGGDLDAVFSEVDGKKASSDTVLTPPVGQKNFDAKRVMAPGGDLDAIDINAGPMGRNEDSGKPVGPIASFKTRPVGDEKEMMFRDRGTFVDSGPDERDGRSAQFNSRSAQTKDGSSGYMAHGFRFRDGTDDDPSLLTDNFHDGEDDIISRPFFKPEMDPDSNDGEAFPVYRPSPNTPTERETFPYPPAEGEKPYSAEVKNAPRQRSDAADEVPGGDGVAYLDVSTAQLEAVIQRIMERIFVEKVEAILQDVLEKAVEREMRHFRSFLAKELEK